MREICVSGGSSVGGTMRVQTDSNTRTQDDSVHKVAVAVIVGSTLAVTGCGCVVVGGSSLAITTASGALTMLGLVSGGAGLVMLAAAANILVGQMRVSK